ncbi:MAG: hypothetical protein AB1597_00880 [Chloroflexota bacterium]
MIRDELRKSLLIFGVLHLAIFLGFYVVIAQLYYPASGEYERSLALQMLDGRLPYRDFVFEYPPLVILAFLAPALLFRTPLAYSFAFAGELLLFDLTILVLLASLAARFNVSVRGSLVVYTVLLLAVGPLAVCRYDLLPAMLVLASLWAFVSRRTAVAWTLIALGVAAKIYPIVLVPLFFVYQVINREYQRLLRGIVCFLGVLFVVAIPWLIIDTGGFWHSLTYHLERGLHSESTYGTALLMAQVLGWTSVEGSLTYGSWNIASPLADALGGLSFYLTVASLTLVYGLFGWLLRKGLTTRSEVTTLRPQDRGWILLQFASLAVLIFMLTNKVFSAQYLLWLCPLLPLLGGRTRYLVWLLFAVAAALTQYVFPYHYIEFELGGSGTVAVLASRNVLLAVTAFVILWGVMHSGGILSQRH